MGRLIDADALKGCKILQPYIGCHTGKAWIREIELDDIPTAYDVEGVVAELNKAESVKTFGSLNSGNRLIPVKDAINIVKKGGIPAAEQEEGEIK